MSSIYFCLFNYISSPQTEEQHTLTNASKWQHRLEADGEEDISAEWMTALKYLLMNHKRRVFSNALLIALAH